MIRSRSLRSQDAGAGGIHGNLSAHWSRRDLLWSYLHGGSRHGLRAGKGLLRNCRHRARYSLVHVCNVRDIRRLIDDSGVIDIRDGSGVDGGVADVDPVHIPTADGIRRYIDFARAEWEPSDVAAEATTATADEDHQRRRIYRRYRWRTGDPTPASAYRHPASVMEWRVAPGLVIDPCISPRIDPVPVAFTIRRPTRFHVGIPDVPVIAFVAPVAIVVEIVIADDVMRKILRRSRIIVAMVSAVRPAIELIRLADLLYIGIQRIGSAERACLSGVQCVGLTVAGSLSFANANVDNRVSPIFTCFQPITSRLRDGKSKVGRIDLEVIVAVQSPHSKIDCAGAQLKLYRVVVQVQKRHTGVSR